MPETRTIMHAADVTLQDVLLRLGGVHIWPLDSSKLE